MLLLLYFLISLFVAGLYYYSSPNWIYTIIVGMLTFGLLFGVYDHLKKRYSKKLNRTLEAIKFINNFIITLSVNYSISTTYDSVINTLSSELKLQNDTIKQFDVEERINYLSKYFDCPIYGVFVNLIKQYVYNGGNILDISQLLLHDSRELEERINEFDFITRKKTRDFIISWGFSIVILMILRISLSQTINNFDERLPMFPLLVFVYFVLVILVSAFFFYRRFNYSFISKGVNKDEKVKTKDNKFKSKSKKWIT